MPVYGSLSSRSDRARANAPAREAISSATTTSGRSRSAALRPSSPFLAARNRSSVPDRRSMLRIARAINSREETSGETSRTFTRRILHGPPVAAGPVARRSGRDYPSRRRGGGPTMTSDIYLDGATATALLPDARDAFVAALDAFADPLTIHGPGRRARRLLEDARVAIARSIGAQPDEIVFTSRGTESVALGIWGAVRAQRELGTRVVVGSVEHPAVGGGCHVLESDGYEAVIVPVGRYGRIDLDRYAVEI